MNNALKELIENFALFDNWEERYSYLIELGQTLPLLDEDLKTQDRLVRGCTSRVWFVPHVENGILTFQADSDALIVKGLIHILSKAYNGCPLDEISKVDIERAFEDLGLSTHLSPNRRNGFFSMVGVIRQYVPA